MSAMPIDPAAWQPNPGGRSTYRRGKPVQTTGSVQATSSLLLPKKKPRREAGQGRNRRLQWLAVLRLLVFLTATLLSATLTGLRLLLTWLLLAGVLAGLLIALLAALTGRILVLIHTCSSCCCSPS
jgi:hypothetical protein